MAESPAQKRKGCGQNVLSHLVVYLLCVFATSLPSKSLSSSAVALDLQQVVALIKQGNMKAAETRLEQAKIESPDDAAVYRLLGIVYQRESRPAEAERALEKAVTLSAETDPQLLFLLCRSKFALKKRREALQLANRVSALAKNNPIAHYSLGQLLLANSSPAEGVRELEKARALAPENPAITTELIIGYLDKDNGGQAETVAADFFKHASYDDLVHAGASLGDAGKFPIAIQAFEQALRLQPGRSDALFNLAFAYYREHRFPEALEALNRINPHVDQDQWDSHYLRGKIDLALHHDQAAASEFTKALSLNPHNEPLCSDAGLLFFRFENFWKAMKVYTTCTSHLPDSAPLETGLGLTYFRLGKYHEAKAAFRRVLAVQPQADAAREALAFLLYIGGGLKEAHSILEQRVGAQDVDYYIYYLNALVLLRLHAVGDHVDALQALNQTLKSNPNFAPAYYEKARIWANRNQPDRALANLRRATVTDSSYAQPYYLMAQVEYKLGKKKEAQEARLRFISLNRKNEGKRQKQQVEAQLLQALR